MLRSWKPVTVDSDRAGLTLAAGAPVKMRGVEIGRVGKVSTNGDGAKILLEIKDDMMERVPADATAQIVPPTAFGSKYVQLSPAKAGSERIQAGAVIPATKTTVEVDEAFANLTKVLDAARPAQVNAALSAAADALNERGEVIGQLGHPDRQVPHLDQPLPGHA